MGAVEEAGKAVGGIIDAVKTEPLVLALCVMMLALIGFMYYQSHSFNSQREDNVKLFVQMQGEVQKLLSQCIVPAPPARPQ
jgi:predicted negative regulator of RcsB-dependent stress response